MDVSPKDAGTVPQTYSVSVSKANLSSNVSYHVTVKNNGNNTINHIVFTATAGALGTADKPLIGIAGYSAFVNAGANDPNCTQPTTPAVSTVTCAIGQLKRGDSRDFFLIFRAPEAGATIHFAGVTDFGNGNSSNVPPANISPPVSNDMTLLAAGGNAVKTVLAPTGGTYFTGDNGAVGGPAQVVVATTVVVPSTTGNNKIKTVTDNGIRHKNQSDVIQSPCDPSNPVPGGSYFCYGLGSKIDILDAKTNSKVFFNIVAPGEFVTITLRQDATSIKSKTSRASHYSPYRWPTIDEVRIFYNPAGDLATGTALGNLVPKCDGTSLPQPDQPCVLSRSVFTAPGSPGPGDRDADDMGWMGYYEYVIRAVDNGVYSW